MGCKEKRNSTGNPERGDAYYFVAIERHSKLILSWHLGRRTARDTDISIEKFSDATTGRFQITTDGFRAYTDAIQYSLRTRVDFVQLVKVYAAPRDGEQRSSPAEVIDAIRVPEWGKPDFRKICKSHVERQNLAMRMQIRRLTGLTTGFSKKRTNLRAMLALYFYRYNFSRIHKTLRVTPAMAAGITEGYGRCVR